MEALPLSARYPCTPRHATRARQAFRVYLALLHLDSRTESDLESAIGEALTNAVEHGYAKETFFELRCNMAASVLTIEIEDHARGAAADTKLERPDISRGYGYDIMRAFVDDVELLKGGSLIRLRKKIKAASRRRPRREAQSAAVPVPKG